MWRIQILAFGSTNLAASTRSGNSIIDSLLSAAFAATMVAVAIFADYGRFYRHRPYEAEAFHTATLQGRGVLGYDGAPWSEHPPLAQTPWRLAGFLFSEEWQPQAARVLTQVSYALSFILFGMLLRRIFTRDHTLTTRQQLGNCLAGYIALTALSMSPPLIQHAASSNGEAVSLLSFGLLVYFSDASLASNGYKTFLGMFCGALLLSWSSCYGLVYAIATVTAVGVQHWLSQSDGTELLVCDDSDKVPCLPLASMPLLYNNRGMMLCGLCIIMALVGATCASPLFCLVSRSFSLSAHYWAAESCDDDSSVPFSFLWGRLTYVNLDGWQMDAVQVGFYLLIFPFSCFYVRQRACRALFLFATVVFSECLFLICERFAGAKILIPHYLSIQYVLLTLAAFMASHTKARWMGVWAIAAVGYCSVIVPSLVAGVDSNSTRPDVIKGLAAEIAESAVSYDRVIFGGSRAFILFFPELPKTVRDSSLIYFRSGSYPDNFVSRNLIAPRQIIRSADLEGLRHDSILYIQLEAAQSVIMPTDRWAVVGVKVQRYPSYTIGDIYRIQLKPVR